MTPRGAAHAVRKLIRDRAFWISVRNEAVIEAPQHRHDEDDARAYVQSLGPEALEPLLEILRTGSELWRIEAVHALGELGDDRAVDAVVEALREAEATGRDQRSSNLPYSDHYLYASMMYTEARRSLERIGGLKATETLARLAASDDAAARKRRLRELRASGKPAPLRADEIMALLGIDPGPLIGDALDFLLLEFAEDPAPSGAEARRRLLEWARDRGIAAASD